MKLFAVLTTPLLAITLAEPCSAAFIQDFGGCSSPNQFSQTPFPRTPYSNSSGGVGCEGIYRPTSIHGTDDKLVFSFTSDTLEGPDKRVAWAKPSTEHLYVNARLFSSVARDYDPLWFQEFGWFLPDVASARYERNITFASGSNSDFFDAPSIVDDVLMRPTGEHALLAFTRTSIGGDDHDVFVPAYSPVRLSHHYKLTLGFTRRKTPVKALTISLSLIDTDGRDLKTFLKNRHYNSIDDNLFGLDLPPLLGGLYRMDFNNIESEPLFFYIGETFQKAERHILSLLIEHRMQVAADNLDLAYGGLSRKRLQLAKDHYAFEVADVRGFLSQAEEHVYGSIDQKTLRGLRAYAEERFSDIKRVLVLRVIGHSGKPSGVQKAKYLPWLTWQEEKIYVSAEQVQGMFQQVLDLILKTKKVAEPKKLTVNLRVATNPQGALFSIYPKSYKNAEREVPTNSTITNLYRGLYQYNIRLEGYKAISGVVDLIDQEGDLLTCQFSETMASLCKLESR